MRRTAILWMITGALGACAHGPPPADAQLVQRLSADFPPGSITTPAVADRALGRAAAAQDTLHHSFTTQRDACWHVFFVNHCLDEVHQAQRGADVEIQRIRLEAHDLQRAELARKHAASRAEEERREAAEELARPDRERQSEQTYEERTRAAQAREQEAQRAFDASVPQVDVQKKEAEHDADVARKDAGAPAREAEAARDYQDKQKEAADYARSRARDREENARRRAERQAARDAAAAKNGEVQSPAPASGQPNSQ